MKLGKILIIVTFLLIVLTIALIKNTPKTKSNLTIIGDSRMVGLCAYQFYKETGGTCIAKVGMGYNWFIDEALSTVSSLSSDKKEYIAINLGVNDLYNVNNYVNKYKELASNSWSDSKIILVSVNPTRDSYEYLNEEIDSFNNKIKELENYNNIIYCDTASILKKDGFLSNDGLHYEKETSEIIFEKIQNCME